MRDRAAAGGPIIRLKISRAPVTGTVMVVARATHDQEGDLDPVAADALGFGDLGDDRGEHQRPVQERLSAAMQTAPRAAMGSDLGGADAEDLAEQQRVDLRFVLGGAGQERGAEGEHHDQREGGHDVVAAAAAEGADRRGRPGVRRRPGR